MIPIFVAHLRLFIVHDDIASSLSDIDTSRTITVTTIVIRCYMSVVERHGLLPQRAQKMSRKTSAMIEPMIKTRA